MSIGLFLLKIVNHRIQTYPLHKGISQTLWTVASSVASLLSSLNTESCSFEKESRNHNRDSLHEAIGITAKDLFSQSCFSVSTFVTAYFRNWNFAKILNAKQSG